MLSRNTLRPLFMMLAFVAGLALPARAMAGPVQFHVTVNTSSIPPATSGFIGFEFDPNPPGPPNPAMATVKNFTSVGGTLGVALDAGTSSGDLSTPPNTLTIVNNPLTTPNEVFQNFTYGSSFAFDVTLNPQMPPLAGSTGSTFSLFVFDGAFGNPLGINPVLQIDLDPNGVATVTGSAFANAQPLGAPQAVPEPATLALLGLGLVGLWVGRRTIRGCPRAWGQPSRSVPVARTDLEGCPHQ